MLSNIHPSGVWMTKKDFFKTICPREGWEQATEVARTARQHCDKRAYTRKVNLPSYRNAVSPLLFLILEGRF